MLLYAAKRSPETGRSAGDTQHFRAARVFPSKLLGDECVRPHLGRKPERGSKHVGCSTHETV